MAILDTSNYPYRVYVPDELRGMPWPWNAWLVETKPEWEYSFGYMWFKDSEAATVFRLKFGL